MTETLRSTLRADTVRGVCSHATPGLQSSHPDMRIHSMCSGMPGLNEIEALLTAPGIPQPAALPDDENEEEDDDDDGEDSMDVSDED